MISIICAGPTPINLYNSVNDKKNRFRELLMKNLFAVVAASVIVSACATGGNNQGVVTDSTANESPAFQASIDYIPSALGPYSWKITTASDVAQQFFDQGLQMRFAYGMEDAARSFRQAHITDPGVPCVTGVRHFHLVRF